MDVEEDVEASILALSDLVWRDLTVLDRLGELVQIRHLASRMVEMQVPVSSVRGAAYALGGPSLS